MAFSLRRPCVELIFFCVFCYWPYPRKTRLRAGSTIRTEGSIHQIRKIVLHREYNPFSSASNNDIGLIFVFEHFVFSNIVKPLQLPSKELGPGSETFVTGWGEQNAV